MDLKLVLTKLLATFQKEDIDYALMGGFALGLWGVGRATVDIDFLVKRNDLTKIDRLMHELGYQCRYKSENVSQYLAPLKIWGEVDFLHAFREASLEMLQRAEEKTVLGGSLKIKVLRPEDIIGLKVQAMSNNPERQLQDLADIKALVLLNKDKLDWPLIEKYFKIFGMEKLYRKIYRSYVPKGTT